MPTAESIRVLCGCGKALKAPTTAIGRKARCPACNGTVLITDETGVRPVKASAPAISRMSVQKARVAPPTVPGARRVPQEIGIAAPPPPPPLPPVDEQDPFEAAMQQAEQESATDTAVRCRQCNAAMPDGAVLCVSCGYDSRTGRKLSTAVEPSPAPAPGLAYAPAVKPREAPVDLMAPTGSFVAGLVFSLIFALAASIVWIVIAYFTGYAIGYIAILIGGASGVGMQVGQKGFSRMGGVTAAGITLVAILLAKLIVLQMVLSHDHSNVSIFDLDPAALGLYFFSPIGFIIMLVGMGAAFRTANGSVTD